MRVYLPGWVSCFCDVLIFLFLIFCDVLTSLAPIILPSSLQQDSWSEPNIWLWVSVSASFRYCLKAIWRQWDIYQSDHKRWTVQAMCLLLLAILGGVIFVYSCEFPLHQVSSWKKKPPFSNHLLQYSSLPFNFNKIPQVPIPHGFQFTKEIYSISLPMDSQSLTSLLASLSGSVNWSLIIHYSAANVHL